MAAPHVAGSYALLVADHPGFALKQYFKRMRQKTCKPILVAPTGAQSCGGVDWDDFPSNHYGSGLLDVAAANGTNASPCQ